MNAFLIVAGVLVIDGAFYGGLWLLLRTLAGWR